MGYDAEIGRRGTCAELEPDSIDLMNSLVLADALNTELLMICCELEVIAEDLPPELHCETSLNMVNHLEDCLLLAREVKENAEVIWQNGMLFNDASITQSQALILCAYFEGLRRLVAFEARCLMPLVKQGLTKQGLTKPA